MRKALFIVLLSVLILSGCNNKSELTFDERVKIAQQEDAKKEQQRAEEREKEQKQRETKNFVDQSQYPQPNIKIVSTTAEVFGEEGKKSTGEYDSYIDPSFGKISKVKGYQYIYTYNDLGIKITIKNETKDFFYTPTKNLLLLRNGNKIFVKDSRYDMEDYIEIFNKDPNKDFEQELNEKHVSSGCKISPYNDEDGTYRNLKGFKLIYIETLGGNLYGSNEDDFCYIDKLNPENQNIILFAMNPKRPDKYYKISISQGCAPGPCTDIESFEFF